MDASSDDIWFDCIEDLGDLEFESVHQVWDHDLREGVFLKEAALLGMVNLLL